MRAIFSNTYNSVCIDDDNIIRILNGRMEVGNPNEIDEIYKKCGYKKFDWAKSLDYLLACDGVSLQDLERKLRARARRAKCARRYAKDSFERYIKNPKEVRDFLISVDNQIDDFETGFSVFVLMKSNHSRTEQAKFIRENTKLFLSFVADELKSKRKKKKYIDLLPFCYISNITVTNRNEAVVTFEIKESIQEAISTKN